MHRSATALHPGAPAAPRRRWYRSLYWRIAVGLFAFLALMLLAQGALMLWVSDRMAGSMPASSPQRLAVLVASDVGAALARDSALDLEGYLRDEYGDVLQTFFVMLRDGRIASNHDDVPADVLLAIRAEAANMVGRQARGQAGRRGRGGEPRNNAAERATVLRPRAAMAQVIVDGAPVGRVAVLGGRPRFMRAVRQFGPMLGLVAGTVLLLGTTVIAFVIFGPTRRRLSEVQAATERLGGGDLAARAPEYGGDEVAALAQSFNRMADELASRARALEASDRARRQLLADVSHELMTPLTAMRGYIETLTMAELQLDAVTRQRYMTIVTDETHRLEQVIGDLLDLARLEGGGITLRRERVDVAALFERVAARHERELREGRIRLVTRVEPEARHVPGDSDRLEQALQNLAANALRHTPAGGAITLSAEPSDGRVRITVRDTGSGIAADHLPLVFDRFFKSDASRKASGGSGLGLSIVKAIVERHGGSIAARNEGGAVFEILLPSSPQDTAA
jgi:two-component system, OmpR family, sensor kinase